MQSPEETMAEPLKDVAHGPLIFWMFVLINFTANGLAWGVLGPLMPIIAGEIGLSYTQIGAVWGATAFGMACFSLIAGSTADRFGVEPVITVALPMTGLLMAARALCSSFLSLTLVMLLIGVVLSFIVPNLTKAVRIVVEQNKLAMANGILTVGAVGGMALAMMLSASVWSPWLGGWQRVILLSGVAILLVWILWLLLVRCRPTTARLLRAPLGDNTGIRENIVRVLRIRDFWILCIVELVMIGIMHAMVGQVPSILSAKGMKPGMAGIFVGVLMCFAIIGMLVVPFLSDKAGNRKGFLIPMCFLAAPLFALQGFVVNILLLVVLALSGICLGSVLPLVRTILVEKREIGSMLAGTGTGGLFTMNRIGGFLFPLIMGGIVDITGQAWAGFIFLGATTLVIGFTTSSLGR